MLIRVDPTRILNTSGMTSVQRIDGALVITMEAGNQHTITADTEKLDRLHSGITMAKWRGK